MSLMEMEKQYLQKEDLHLKQTPQIKRRICCFCEKWESGGIESFLCGVLLHMDLSDLEVDIVAARLENSVFTEPLKARGIGFYQLSGKLRSPANGPAFLDLLKKRRYNVVYFNIFQGLSLYYVSLAQKAEVPIRIAHSHGMGLRNSLGQEIKLCFHQLGKVLWSSSITDFWACSQSAAKFLFLEKQTYQWVPDGIEIVRFCFQPKIREEQRKALGLSEDTFLIGTVGRLSEEKNHSFLLEVFFEIKKKRKESALIIVGAGHLEKQLRMQAQKLGIEKNVIFYGASSQVEQLLWAMDLFIFPSYMEGLGIAGVEAQAAGLSMLCSKAIPLEAIMTKQTVQLELSAGPKVWAEKALGMKKAVNRESAIKTIAAAGYDIQTVADWIKRGWMGTPVE